MNHDDNGAYFVYHCFIGAALAFFAGIPKSKEEQRKDDEAQMRYLKDWKNRKKK